MEGLLKRIPGHVFVAASAWVGRVVFAVAGLITIRVLIGALGTEQYAIYALLAGLQGWYLLVDLGVGWSLQNHISERRARQESYSAFIAAAWFMALLLLGIALTGLYLLAPLCGALILKSFPFMSDLEKGRQFFVAGALGIVAGLSGIAYKVWYAEQKGYLANIMPAMAALLSLSWIMLIARSGIRDKLFWSLIASFLPLAALSAGAFFYQFWKHRVAVGEMRIVFRVMMKRALKFWGLGVMGAGVLQIDYLLMSQFLGARDIIVYNFSSKIFSLLYFIYYALLLAVWPVCAEAVARNEWDRVKGYLRRYIGMGCGFMVIATLVLYVAMPSVVRILSPREPVVIPLGLIVVFGVYYVVRVWTDTYAIVLQSMSYFRPLWLLVPFQALLSASLQWLLIPRLGSQGVVVGMASSFLLTVVWGLPLALNRRTVRTIRAEA